MLGKVIGCSAILSLTTLLLPSASCEDARITARHFRMGFTGFPHGTGLGFGSDFDRSDGSAPLSDSERFDKSVCFLVLFSRRR